MKRSTYLSALSLILILGLIISVPQIGAAVNDFTDYDENDFGYEEVSYLVAEEVIFGLPGNIFAPKKPVSRAETAVMFQRALDLPTGGDNFADVPAKQYYTDAAAAVKLEGIFKGKPGNIFGAEDLLTREQMASVLVRAFDLKPITTVPVTANDLNQVSDWALADVKTLYQNGVTNGKGNIYDPKGVVSRAEFSVFLYRALVGQDVPEPAIPPVGGEVPPVTNPPGGEQPGPGPAPEPEPVELEVISASIKINDDGIDNGPADVIDIEADINDINNNIKFILTEVPDDGTLISGSIAVSEASTLTLTNIPMKPGTVLTQELIKGENNLNVVEKMNGYSMGLIRIGSNFTVPGTLKTTDGRIKNIQLEFIIE